MQFINVFLFLAYVPYNLSVNTNSKDVVRNFSMEQMQNEFECARLITSHTRESIRIGLAYASPYKRDKEVANDIQDILRTEMEYYYDLASNAENLQKTVEFTKFGNYFADQVISSGYDKHQANEFCRQREEKEKSLR